MDVVSIDFLVVGHERLPKALGRGNALLCERNEQRLVWFGRQMEQPHKRRRGWEEYRGYQLKQFISVLSKNRPRKPVGAIEVDRRYLTRRDV